MAPTIRNGSVTAGNGVGQFGLRLLEGQILLAGEESHERPATQGVVFANGPAQRRIGCFQRVEHRTERDGIPDLELHLAVNVRQRAQVKWQHDANHGRVWTSTE